MNVKVTGFPKFPVCSFLISTLYSQGPPNLSTTRQVNVEKVQDYKNERGLQFISKIWFNFVTGGPEIKNCYSDETLGF